jgi:DNA-binding transcriptional MerR regulator
MMEKSPDAFRTISEVAEHLDVPQHVLRFWETRFSQIKPLKRGGGRRYYRPDDVDLLRGIRHLLYGEGYTIKGVQRILKEEGPRFVQSIGRGDERAPARSRADPDASGGKGEEETEDEADDAAEPVTRGGHFGKGTREHEAEEEEAELALGEGDLERLRTALAELIECKRVLNTLVAVDDSGSEGAPD